MPTAPTPITALPPAPNPDADEASFDTAAYAYSAAQPTCVTQTNALAANVYANAVEAATAAGTAATQAGLATNNGAEQVALATTQVGLATTQAEIAATNAGLTAANAVATAADRVQTELDRTAAAASAASAAAVAGAFVGTSTSSVVIGAGNKSFTTQAGEQYTTGVFMTAVSAANSANYMAGQVVSYSGTTLVIDVSITGGSGTFADWNLSIAGPQGATGPQGTPGTGVTPQAVGFTLTGGATPKTLTVDETASVSDLLAAIGVAVSGIIRSPRSANSILVAADKGKLIDITDGTFTQTFTAAATLGNGWYCYLRNSGTGDITLDPNAAETIDGLTSYVMYPGEVRIIQCDSVSLRSIVIQAYNKTSISSLTLIRPPGYKAHEGILWSGGAGGGFGNTSTLVLGGRPGGAFPFTIPHEAMPASVDVQIGAGGSSRSTTGLANPGGDSAFGSLFTVKGATSAASGAISLDGTTALVGAYPVETSVFAGGGPNTNWGGNIPNTDLTTATKSLWGGAAGATWVGAQAAATPSGVSTFGGNGGALAQPGLAPGGGGGASYSTNAGLPSGPGARGELRIWGIV